MRLQDIVWSKSLQKTTFPKNKQSIFSPLYKMRMISKTPITATQHHRIRKIFKLILHYKALLLSPVKISVNGRARWQLSKVLQWLSPHVHGEVNSYSCAKGPSHKQRKPGKTQCLVLENNFICWQVSVLKVTDQLFLAVICSKNQEAAELTNIFDYI